MTFNVVTGKISTINPDGFVVTDLETFKVNLVTCSYVLYVDIYYRYDDEWFSWSFSGRKFFETMHLLLNSKHDVYLRAGHLIERSIIHE